jgi:hypothetical protein
MVLAVSLLVKYYSIVVVDDYVFKSAGEMPMNAGHKFLYSGAHYDLPIPEKIATLRQRVEHYFPGYQYAPHELLFNYTIRGGFPYNSWYEHIDKGVIYDFLFCDDFVNTAYTVAH